MYSRYRKQNIWERLKAWLKCRGLWGRIREPNHKALWHNNTCIDLQASTSVGVRMPIFVTKHLHRWKDYITNKQIHLPLKTIAAPSHFTQSEDKSLYLRCVCSLKQASRAQLSLKFKLKRNEWMTDQLNNESLWVIDRIQVVSMPADKVWSEQPNPIVRPW